MTRSEGRAWRETTLGELLGLSAQEEALAKLHGALAVALQGAREKLGLRQTEVAELLGTSQAAVSRMEAGGMTLDRKVRALLALGVGAKEIGRALSRAA